MFLTLGFNAPANAQRFSIISEDAYQLADVCRIKVSVRTNSANSPSFSVGFFLNDGSGGDVNGNILLASISINPNQRFSIEIEESEYSNMIRIDTPEPLDTTVRVSFDMTLWLNLPRDYAKTISYLGYGVGNDIVLTNNSYSIAQNCPKGN